MSHETSSHSDMTSVISFLNDNGRYKRMWEDALAICRSSLDVDELDDIFDCATCEELLERLHSRYDEYANKAIPRILRSIEWSLASLKKLNVVVAVAMGARSPVRTGLLWGLMNLLIETLIRNEHALAVGAEIIDELNNEVEILLLYQSWALVREDMEQVYVEVFVEIIKFASTAVAFFRRTPLENFTYGVWPQDVSILWEKMSKKINKKIGMMKEKSSVLSRTYEARPTRADLMREMGRSGLATPASYGIEERDTHAESPKSFYFIPMRPNPSFFGRENILDQLHSLFGNVASSSGQPAVSLWGTSGIGKTQIALAYAWKKKLEELPIVLWVNCESSLDITRSFTEIALDAKLPGVTGDADDEQNRIKVLKWLGLSSENWLLIFDNVEDIGLVRDNWPASETGFILMTSRCEIFSPGVVNIEVESFDEESGARFLMKELYADYSNELELAAAKKLCAMLGGLPLGLVLMLIKVQTQKCTIESFLPFYKKNEERLHGYSRPVLKPYYSRGLDTAWDISFNALEEESPDAAHLFSVLCFLASDDIPITMFSEVTQSSLPQHLRFCSDSWALNDAIQILLRTSLAKQSHGTRILSIHRLTQTNYLRRVNGIGKDELTKCFSAAATLLRNTFPKLADSFTLRKSWVACRQYAHHVRTLVSHCDKLSVAIFSPETYAELTGTLHDCAWYLFECGSWAYCEEMLSIGLQTCTDRNSLLYANLINIQGIIAATRNRTTAAHPLLEESCRIRRSLLGENHMLVANSYTNLANVMLAKAEYLEAIEFHKKAIAIDSQSKLNEFQCIRYINLGSVFMFQGNNAKAQEEIEAGRLVAERDTGDSMHYRDTATWDMAHLSYYQGDYANARRLFDLSWKAWNDDNPLHPFTGASVYRIGCVDVKRGDAKSAIRHLEQALIIAKYNEETQGNKGDIARVVAKLSVAYRLDGETVKADNLHEEAKGMRKLIQGEDFKEEEDSEAAYDSLVSYYPYYYR
ncbi:hypothetical protein GGS24DRAFT_512674 [Hypoxylon argillaceum]|nr:hypothetical protein GGS24DRAFT_512674 [Hypoxylon argillaceum]